MKAAFVKKYYPYAKEAEHKTGVPAIFALAQSALESGWGKKSSGYMLFGMKAGSGRNYGGWTGQSQLITTTEYDPSPSKNFPFVYSGYPVATHTGQWKYLIKDYFRAYPTPLHTFLDWAGLLSRSSRYRQAMKSRQDPFHFAEAVAKAGYATDPDYAGKVKRLMAEINRIIKTEGIKPDQKRKVVPVILLIMGVGLVIYGAIKHSKRISNTLSS